MGMECVSKILSKNPEILITIIIEITKDCCDSVSGMLIVPENASNEGYF